MLSHQVVVSLGKAATMSSHNFSTSVVNKGIKEVIVIGGGLMGAGIAQVKSYFLVR